jgi:hypothetical protein
VSEFTCDHPHFMTSVDVHRLTREDGGPVYAFASEFHVNCAVCGLPFAFLCPDGGVLPDRPAISVEGTELRAPMVPADRPEMRSDVGFRVSVSPELIGRKQA